MADIFLSYAREDRECARLLAPQLEARGWSVFWDVDSIPPHAMAETLEREIAAARCVVVLWSRYSVVSRWVFIEASEGDLRKALVPILIDEVRPPIEFRRVQPHSLLDWRNGIGGPQLQRIIESITGILGEGGRPVRPQPAAAPPSSERVQVFISYSHRDVQWLQRLQVHLRPLERHNLIRRWDDTLLQGGEDWRREIRDAIARTKVAILLVSADFLASDFVYTDELPPLLSAAASGGAVILPIAVSACNLEPFPELAKFQMVNPPSKPLDDMTPAQQEKLFASVAKRVASILAKQTST